MACVGVRGQRTAIAAGVLSDYVGRFHGRRGRRTSRINRVGFGIISSGRSINNLHAHVVVTVVAAVD